MAFTAHHNITTIATQVLIAVGENAIVSSISVANVHASSSVAVNLMLHRDSTFYYLFKNLVIPSGTSLLLDSPIYNFDNSSNGYSLLMKLASAVPVDVVIRSVNKRLNP